MMQDRRAGPGPWARMAPVWTRYEGVRELPRRWERELEPWEEEHRGAEDTTVLDDLPMTAGNLSEAAGVLTRFAVLRLVLRAAAQLERGATLEESRAATGHYVALPDAVGEAERQALATALRLASVDPPPQLYDALLDAATYATERGHDAGARALVRSAYDLALERDAFTQAGRAARMMATMARVGGGRRSYRRWRRRAAVLERWAQAEEG